MANLGDLLSGAAGAPVNRPALDAYVTQGQAMAGLRTAQTEDALLNAQQARDKMGAYDNLAGSLQAAGWKPADAQAFTNYARATGRDPNELFEAHNTNQTGFYASVVADPNAPQASRIAAMQALAKKFDVGQTQDVGNQLVNPTNPNGPPVVTQTPMSESIENKNNAAAELSHAHATNPQAFNPNALSPQELAAVVDYIHKNPGAAPTGYSLSRPGGAAIAGALDKSDTSQTPGAAPATGTGIAAAPGVSYQEQAQIRNDFAHGIGAKQVSSLNTMYQHSQLFDQIADQLHNGNFTPTNQINVAWQRLFGSPAPANLATAAAFLGREAIRATVNSGAGTGEERELQIGPTASPEQLHGVAQTLRTLVGGQLHSLELRARRGGVDISPLLSSEARAAYGMASPQAAAPAAGGPPQNDLAAAALAELQRRGIHPAAAGGAQ